MSKRFISTDLFNDSWFMELSTNSKLFYIYLLTNCDNAGIIDLNVKLAEFQTGIPSLNKNFGKYFECLKTRLLHLKDNYYFLTKFVLFQYPKGLSESVKPQKQVIEKLKKFNLYDEENLTVKIDLVNSMDTVQETYKETVIETKKEEEKKTSKEKIYRQFAHLKLTNTEFLKLRETYGKKKIDDTLDSIENYKKNTNYKSLFLTCKKWLRREHQDKQVYDTPVKEVIKREQVLKQEKQEKINKFDPSKLPDGSIVKRMLGTTTPKDSRKGLRRISDI